VTLAQPGLGAMGVHMLNPSLLDRTIEADKPELLVHEPTANGKLKLVALNTSSCRGGRERSHRGSSDGSSTSRPGRTASTSYPFYSLHGWIWKPNPSGILEPWNPHVSC
jgi:hypothetical protein